MNIYSLDSSSDHDYLQDPSLWRDCLPQPFRMLDQLIQDLVTNVWDEIKRRELERMKTSRQQKVTKTDDVSIIVDIPDPQALVLVRFDGKEYIIVGGVLGLYVLKLASKNESHGIVTQTLCGEACFLDAQEIGEDVGALVVVGGSKDIVKLMAFYDNTLKELCDIEGVSGIQGMTLSSTGSHLIIAHTTEVPEQESVFLVEVYSLPVDLWIQQLQDSAFQGIYAKHTVLFTLQPPSPLTPCLMDPIQVIKQYDDKATSVIPTGQRHNLTEKYFNARRNGFVARRPDFVQPLKPPQKIMRCTMKYLHYWKGSHSVNPSVVAVHWEGSSQLWLYSLAPGSKGKAPERIFSQAGRITSIAVSDRSHYLALGLDSGCIATYNMKTDALCGVVGPFHNTPVTSLLFLPTSNVPVLVVGSGAGDISIIKYPSSSQPEVASLTKNYGESLGSIMQINFNSHLPKTVTSYDDAGRVVVWDTKRGCPLCQLTLPSAYSPVAAKNQFLTASEVAMIIGQTTSDAQPCSKSLFYWSLLSCEALRKAWLAESMSTGVLEPSVQPATVTDALLLLIQQPVEESDLQTQLMDKWNSYNSKIHCTA